MLKFQPPGFGQFVIQTSLGVMAYYTPVSDPWRSQLNGDEDLPSLIFLHSLGGGSSAYEWSKVYPAFAPDFRVIAPDLIGWGQSTHPMRDYQIDDYFQMLTELIEQTSPQPVTVMASSLTAGITLRLATQRPDLFQSLFLICPSGYSDFGSDYRRGMAAQLAGFPGLDRLVYNWGAANADAVRNFLQQFLFAQRSRVTEEMVSAFLTSATQLNAEYAALSSLKGNLCFDLALYIEKLEVPTVFVWGEKAWFSTINIGQRLRKLNPGAVKAFHVVPDAGVLPHLETPEIVTGLLRSHLATLF
jgi:pimeloyl-ACP methyl ester carboxylesterase